MQVCESSHARRRHYQVANNPSALDALRRLVTRPEKQEYKVWEDGYLAKELVTLEFLDEKVRYTHNNPCQPHWLLADSPEEYPWSSARFYAGDGACLIPVEDVRALLG